jgi:hypothetical protein
MNLRLVFAFILCVLILGCVKSKTPTGQVVAKQLTPPENKTEKMIFDINASLQECDKANETNMKERCYGLVAFKVAIKDHEKGFEICKKIVNTTYHAQCKDGIIDVLMEFNQKMIDNICDETNHTCKIWVSSRVARSDLNKGLKMCKEINKTNQTDECYTNIAEIVIPTDSQKALTICEKIQTSEKKDKCYKLVARGVCERITNTSAREICLNQTI